MPLSPPARVLAMLQMFCGVMYLALIVTRLIALQYIKHTPKRILINKEGGVLIYLHLCNCNII